MQPSSNLCLPSVFVSLLYSRNWFYNGFVLLLANFLGFCLDLLRILSLGSLGLFSCSCLDLGFFPILVFLVWILVGFIFFFPVLLFGFSKAFLSLFLLFGLVLFRIPFFGFSLTFLVFPFFFPFQLFHLDSLGFLFRPLIWMWISQIFSWAFFANPCLIG